MVNPKPSVFLFVGSDSYSKGKALDELRSSLLDSSSNQLDYKVFYGNDADIREVLDCAKTVPLLAAKKIIVIKDAEKLSKEDKQRLIDCMKKGPGSTCFVLQCSDDSFLEEDGDLTGSASVRRFDGLTDHEVDLWMKRILDSNGKKLMTPDAMEALKELQGQDLLSLNQELEKLVTFVGERDEINSSDVEEVAGKTLAATAFDLTAAIEGNRMDDAMRIIAELTLSGKKHYEIIGLLCWQLRRMMKARILRDKGEPDSRIASALKVNRRYANGFFDQLNALDINKIRARMRILLEADLHLKRTKYEPALILEFAVMRLCLN